MSDREKGDAMSSGEEKKKKKSMRDWYEKELKKAESRKRQRLSKKDAENLETHFRASVNLRSHFTDQIPAGMTEYEFRNEIAMKVIHLVGETYAHLPDTSLMENIRGILVASVDPSYIALLANIDFSRLQASIYYYPNLYTKEDKRIVELYFGYCAIPPPKRFFKYWENKVQSIESAKDKFNRFERQRDNRQEVTILNEFKEDQIDLIAEIISKYHVQVHRLGKVVKKEGEEVEEVPADNDLIPMLARNVGTGGPIELLFRTDFEDLEVAFPEVADENNICQYNADENISDQFRDEEESAEVVIVEDSSSEDSSSEDSHSTRSDLGLPKRWWKELGTISCPYCFESFERAEAFAGHGIYAKCSQYQSKKAKVCKLCDLILYGNDNAAIYHWRTHHRHGSSLPPPPPPLPTSSEIASLKDYSPKPTSVPPPASVEVVVQSPITLGNGE
jgi:hypothetical protein